MKYALGNMLNGAGGLNADGLSLDLQFAADKTLTARKGPTPTFTRASTATFVGSNGLIQSAAINAARFDHDPLTQACKGLLIEEQRVNIVFPSDTLATQTRTVTATAHTLSFYGTGTVVLSGTHIATVVGTGSYPTRTALTFTPTAGSLTLTVTGSVTQAQLEAGSFPTSYIPTTTGPVTRSADTCSITGSAFTSFYNPLEGSVIVRGDKTMSSVATGGYLTFLAGATEVGPFIVRTPTQLLARIRNSSGVDVANADVTESPVGTKSIGVSWKANSITSDRSVVSNGAIVVLTNLQALDAASSQSSLSIGSRAASIFNGHISRLTYYKKRLPNAKLQTLTT